MLPEVESAQSLPVPAPIVPWLSRRPPCRSAAGTPRNPLVIRPERVCRATARSLSSRTRTVIEPDVVASRTSLCRGLDRSQVIAPETVRACTRAAGLSARISS